MSIAAVPKGFRLTGVRAGLKRDPDKFDLALVVSDRPATAAGVYTQNLVFAAPVKLDRARTPAATIRAVVINSGNANACTGERGDRDAARMAELAAGTCGAQGDQALVLSTGVIGEFLPIEKIASGIGAAAEQLGSDEASLVAAARAMMTTDTRPKLAGRSVEVAGQTVQITGMAKGAAMIGPRMATMLGLILSDAALEPTVAQQALSAAVEDSFNCISVDGHMSTNDTVLLVASGAAGTAPLAGADLARFQAALNEVCAELARAIPADGEGATHLVTIDVRGCATRAAAHRIAKTVAESPLVKTALAGADPNWGRIVSAAGYAGLPFNPSGVTLHLNGVKLYQAGSPVAFDADQVSKSIREQYETSIVLDFTEGAAAVRFWTTDLTADYVKLNADYHT
ncbi:MAG TPA: bifunctional glutamate N-acetyltransferase/amino-acid acetyltransferase ArgJ [Pirellulales bacterium]|jgi:glutamate N-acetyltransferase/amino-acid N-acetyltransferase|nr:bifunctional glutamate N-acetyltransferase/amino-acid acetyltransferase ArgJ [Pirellulales bacterium]